MALAFEEDAERFEHVWLIVGNENAAHKDNENRISGGASICM